MSIIPFYQVDAFTRQRFSGNSAAVCPLTDWLPDHRLQQIAAENNLSETAFFVREDEHCFALRWFTPTVEVELCGHATLASAHVLFNHLDYPHKHITFATQKRGELRVSQTHDGYQMNFPVNPATPVTPPAALLAALNIVTDHVLATAECDNWLIELVDIDAVKKLQPDYVTLAKISPDKGVIVTAQVTPEAIADKRNTIGNTISNTIEKPDFVSRYFAPMFGIDEDPVTGSAHATLTPYWASKLSRDHLHARQISTRGGDLYCELRGDRVMITGHAVTVIQGTFDAG